MTKGASLRFGRQMVAIPGPSVIPDRVLDAFSQPMPDLYAGPLVPIATKVREQLPSIAQTSGECFMVIGNGHSAWQMATSNTLARGDKVLVLETGRFASVWGIYTAVSDVEVEQMDFGMREAIDPDAVEARLREDTEREIKAILCVHVDTASSVKNDIPALRRAMDNADHPALLMVDCIASMGCDEFRMDQWRVDIAVAGCQKGLMVPPGVAFVWVSEKAGKAHERADQRVGYFDWESRRDTTNMYSYYAGTPPIAHIRGLHAAFELIDEEGGIEAVWGRHQVLADGVRAAVSAWEAPGGLEFNIASPDHRANCVTTVRAGELDYAAMREMAEHDAGLIIGLGIADVPGFRIAHMGHLNPPMILGTLGTIESLLHAAGAPPATSGVAAAAAVIGNHLAP